MEFHGKSAWIVYKEHLGDRVDRKKNEIFLNFFLPMMTPSKSKDL